MPRDYKHQANAPREKSGSGWLLLVLGFLAGLIVGTALNLGTDWLRLKSVAQAVPDAAQAVQEEVNNAAANPADNAKQDEPATDETRFDFYRMLPNFEVVIPEQDETVQRGGDVTQIAQPGTYVLQAGSFRGMDDADRLKAQLALLGITSHIQEVTIDDTQTWYRVRIGPYQDLNQLNSIRTRLEDNGLPSLLIRVGD